MLQLGQCDTINSSIEMSFLYNIPICIYNWRCTAMSIWYDCWTYLCHSTSEITGCVKPTVYLADWGIIGWSWMLQKIFYGKSINRSCLDCVNPRSIIFSIQITYFQDILKQDWVYRRVLNLTLSNTMYHLILLFYFLYYWQKKFQIL